MLGATVRVPAPRGVRLGGRLRVLFAGTDNFAAIALNRLIQERRTVERIQVLCPGPRNRRGGVSEPVPVHIVATEHGIATCLIPPGEKSLRHVAGTADGIARCSTPKQEFHGPAPFDVGLVASFGYKIPLRLVRLCRAGMINIHPSRLPRLRGAAPVAHTLLQSDGGDGESCGVSVIRVSEVMDGGDVIGQVAWALGVSDTTESLTASLAEAGSEIVARCLERLRSDLGAGEECWSWAVAQSQLSESVGLPPGGWTEAPKVSAADGELQWGGARVSDARHVVNVCRAMSRPFGWGAWGRLAGTDLPRRAEGAEFRILKTGPVEPGKHPPGSLTIDQDKRVWLDCEGGERVEVLRALVPGMTEMDGKSVARWLRGASRVSLGSYHRI
jgi:methionyl-tRNA formyltransferase